MYINLVNVNKPLNVLKILEGWFYMVTFPGNDIYIIIYSWNVIPTTIIEYASNVEQYLYQWFYV